MKLTCKRPCSFGGRRFFIGEEIPAELVDNPAKQEKYGVLSISPGEAEAELLETNSRTGAVNVPVFGDESEDTEQAMSVPLTEGDVQHLVSVLQMDVSDAEKEIQRIDSENLLIVLHACDSRAGVKKAAKKKAANLSSAEQQKNEARSGIASSEGTVKTDTDDK